MALVWGKISPISGQSEQCPFNKKLQQKHTFNFENSEVVAEQFPRAAAAGTMKNPCLH